MKYIYKTHFEHSIISKFAEQTASELNSFLSDIQKKPQKFLIHLTFLGQPQKIVKPMFTKNNNQS